MINTLQDLLTFENIYLFANWGILPFWILLIVAPNQGVTRALTQSVIAPLILAAGYIFIAYKIYLEGNIFEGFSLYLSLEDLYSLFSDESFLLIFWLHFLSISLFAGCWIVRDSQRYLVPRVLTVISLTLTYFSGPIGLMVYWFVRIFFAKKISFNE